MDLPPRRLGQRVPQKAPPLPAEPPPGRLGPGIGGALSGSSVNDFLARAALRNGGRGLGGVSESEQSGWSESDVDAGGSWAPSGGFSGPSAGPRRQRSGSREGGNSSGFVAPSLDSHAVPESASATASLETKATTSSAPTTSVDSNPSQAASEDTTPRPTSARDRGAGFARSAAALLASPDKTTATERGAQPFLSTQSPGRDNEPGGSSSNSRRRSSGGGSGGEALSGNGPQMDALDAAALAEESPRKQPASKASPGPTASSSGLGSPPLLQQGLSPRRQPSPSPRREPSPSPRREPSSSSKREQLPSPRREPSPSPRRNPPSVRPSGNPQLAASAPAPFTAAMLGVEEPSSTAAAAAAKEGNDAAPVRVANAWVARNDDNNASLLNDAASRNRFPVAADVFVTNGDASSASAESKPCDQFRVDLTGATFGVCKCGHEKSMHQVSAQTSRSGGSRSKGAKSERSKKDKKADSHRAIVPPPSSEPPQASPRSTAANVMPSDSKEAKRSQQSANDVVQSSLPEPKNDVKAIKRPTDERKSSSSQRALEAAASDNTGTTTDASVPHEEKPQPAPATVASPMLRAPPKLSPLKLRDHATIGQGPQVVDDVAATAHRLSKPEAKQPLPKSLAPKGNESLDSSPALSETATATAARGLSKDSTTAAAAARAEWAHHPQQSPNLAEADSDVKSTKSSQKVSRGAAASTTTATAPRMSGSGWLDGPAAAARAEAKAAEHDNKDEGGVAHQDASNSSAVSPFKDSSSSSPAVQQRPQHDPDLASVAVEAAAAAPLPQSKKEHLSETLVATDVDAGESINDNALSDQVPPLDYGHSMATQPKSADIQAAKPGRAPVLAPAQVSGPASTTVGHVFQKPEVPAIAPQGRLRARVTTQMGADDSDIRSEKAPLSRAGRRHSLDGAPQVPPVLISSNNTSAAAAAAAAAALLLPSSSSAAGTDPDSDAFWNRLQDDEDRDVVSALDDSENPGAFELFGGGRARTTQGGGSSHSSSSSSSSHQHTSKVSPMKPHNHTGGTWKASKAFGRRGSRYDSGEDDHHRNGGATTGSGSGSLANTYLMGQRLGTARTSDDETGADTENEFSPAKSIWRPHSMGSKGPSVLNVDLEATPASWRASEALQTAQAKASSNRSNKPPPPTGDVLADSLAAHAASEASSAAAAELSAAQAAVEAEIDREEVPGEGSGSLAAACGLPLPGPERRWLLRPLYSNKGQVRAEVRRHRGTGELLFFLQGVGNGHPQGHEGEQPTTTTSTFVLGARPGKGSQKGELLISLADAFGQQRGGSSSSSIGSGPIIALRPESATGNGWSMQYLGLSGGEVGACLLSAGISPDGGKTKVPRVGCVALPVFQATSEQDASTTAASSASNQETAPTSDSTTPAGSRRLCVWRDHTTKKGSSAMLASVARGDMEAMLLLRAASPHWIDHPDSISNENHHNGTSSATAEGSSGRYEIPPWPIGSGGSPFTGANTEPSRKTLVLLDTTSNNNSSSNNIDNTGGAASPRAVFALARVTGERDTFAVTFAAPLSPLHAFAAACVAIGSNAKGADVALAGASWPQSAGTAAAHNANNSATNGASSSSSLMATPRDAAMAALSAAGLGPPQKKVLPPLSAGSAAPEALQPSSKGPEVVKEDESIGSPATAHSRQELLQQQPKSESSEENERNSEATTVDAEVVAEAHGRLVKRRTISVSRDDREGSHESFDGRSSVGGPLLGSPDHYPQGSLAAKLMPFSPMAAAASHVAESALTAGLDYFTDMPPGYPPTNDPPSMVTNADHREGTDRSARGGADERGGSRFHSRYQHHDNDDDDKSWQEEGPKRRLSDELYGGADEDDEERGDISSRMQSDAHAPRLTDSGGNPVSEMAASFSSERWDNDNNLHRNDDQKDPHRLKQAARWYGFRFLCKTGWHHEHAQLNDACVVGSLVYFGLAMVAELYPSGPTYQLALAAILLYLHAFDDNSPSVLFLRRRDRRHQESALLYPEDTTNEDNGLELATKHTLVLGDSPYSVSSQSRSSASAARAVFVPALEWRGPVEGSVFKLGILGLGYYQDSASVSSIVAADGDASTPRENGGSSSRSGSENGSDGARSPLHPTQDESGNSNNNMSDQRPNLSSVEQGVLSVGKSGENVKSAQEDVVEESAFGGILTLHAPNGALWWSLACAIIITVAGDLDFLSSSETRVSVGWRGLEDGVRRSDKALAVRRIVFVTTAIALPLKVGLFYAAAQRHARGRRVMRRLIGQLEPFLPPYTSMPTKPSKLALATEARLVALTWLHGVVAAVLLCLGVIAVTVLSDASQTYGFGASRAGNLPLTALFFLKGATTLVVFGVLAAEMQLAQCVSRFGCLLMVWRSAPPPKALRSARARRNQGALPLTPTTLRGLAAAKALDLLGAIFFGAALIEQSSAFAANGGMVTDASALACFRLAVGCAAVGDVLGTVLVATALWFLANLLTREDRWDGEFSDSDTDSGSDSNSDSSDDDSSRSSDRSDDNHDDNKSGRNDSDSNESTDDDDDDASTDSEDCGSDYDGNPRSLRRSKERQRSSKAQSKTTSTKKKKGVSYDGIPVPDLDDGFDDFIFSFGDEPLGTARGSHGGSARGSTSKATKKRRSRSGQRQQSSPTLEGYDYQMQAASDPYRTTAPSPQEQLAWQRQRASVELAHSQGRPAPPPPVQMMSPQQSQQQLGFVPPPPPLPRQVLDPTYGNPGHDAPGYSQGDGDWWWNEQNSQWVNPGNGDGGDNGTAQEQGGYWDEQGNWVDGWWDEQGQWVTSSDSSNAWDQNAAWASSGDWAEKEQDGLYGNVTESSWPSATAATTGKGDVSPVPPPPLTARDAIRARAIAAAGGTAAPLSSTTTPLRAPSLSRSSAVTHSNNSKGMTTPLPLSSRSSGVAHHSGSNSNGGVRSSRSSPPAAHMGKAAFSELWESWGDGSSSSSSSNGEVSRSSLSQDVAVQTLSTSLAGPAMPRATGTFSNEAGHHNGSWLSAVAVSEHLTARGFSVVSAMHSGGALRVHATAKGPPRPTESSGMPNPTREGATFLLEMLFSGPGFDGLGAVFAEGKDGDGKEEGDFLELTFKCNDANELPTFVKKLNLNRLVATC